MIKIKRIWNASDEQDHITLLNRPRISIKVDEYIWGKIEQNIVIPKKIMQNNRYEYHLLVALEKYNPESCQFFPPSPYNGSLKEDAVLSEHKNPSKLYHYKNFIGAEERKRWFFPEKFWTNGGNKTALIHACAEYVNKTITPKEYADLLFDAFAASLIYNFKKLTKAEFDELKLQLEQDVVSSFPYPAPFLEQKYQGDDGSLRVTHFKSNGTEEVSIEIPDIENFYKQHYHEDE